MKNKPDSSRTYDAEGFKRRAACICLKKNSSSWQVLMVNSSKRPHKWIFPGGGVEPGEKSSCTAIREASEEAGVVGVLHKYLGRFEVTNIERKHRTEVYVMMVQNELPEWDESKSMGRQRKWFTIEEALKHLNDRKAHQVAYLESMMCWYEGTML